jgi:hypothetical protein
VSNKYVNKFFKKKIKMGCFLNFFFGGFGD